MHYFAKSSFLLFFNNHKIYNIVVYTSVSIASFNQKKPLQLLRTYPASMFRPFSELNTALKVYMLIVTSWLFYLFFLSVFIIKSLFWFLPLLVALLKFNTWLQTLLFSTLCLMVFFLSPFRHWLFLLWGWQRILYPFSSILSFHTNFFIVFFQLIKLFLS